MNVKRPLIWLLISYAAGLALYNVKLAYIIIIAGLCLFVLGIWFYKLSRQQKKSNGFLLSMPFLFILGFILMNRQLSPNSMDGAWEKEAYVYTSGQLVMIQEKEGYQILTLKNNKVSIPGDKYRKINYFSKKLIIYTNSKNSYKIGNILTVSGKIQKFRKASNPGQFNEYQYNRMLHIDYKISADTVVITDSHYSIFRQSLYQIKNKFTNVYRQILPPGNAGILSAMILGETSLLDADLKELFRQSGISHILAISGLHISILGLTLYRLLRHMELSNVISSEISIFIIFSYGVLTNFSVSTNRAVVMMIILMSAGLIGRTYDLLSAAALSALIILIQSPLQIKNAGFLLSFGAIMGIAVMNPVISKLISINNKLLKELISGISIQLVTLPVILFFFYEIPVYSVFINLIILPTSSIIILLAILAGITGCIWLPAGTFLIGAVHYLLNFYEWVCHLGEKLPYRTFLVGRPDIGAIAAYYSILIILVILHKKLNPRAAIILFSCLLILFFKAKNVTLNITFMDVGQGDGIFMMTPKGTTFFIDGGSTDVSKVGKYRIEPYLKINGIGGLDYAVVTHMDSDHISGLKEMMEEMKPVNEKKNNRYNGTILIHNLILPDISDKDEAFMDMVNLALSRGINILYISKGDTIKDGDVKITCLHPKLNYTFTSRNAYSTVLCVNYKSFDLLLTGDLEQDGEKMLVNLLKDQPDIHKNTGNGKKEHIEVTSDYDVLKVAHHGSKNSTYEDFLRIIKPEYSIISCGRDNSYGHPDPELIQRLKNIGSNIKITCESGAVTIHTDGINMMIDEYLLY